ncbi:MAG: hypothetical protein CL670_14875 [Balneola sp.]|nr:hypothetical protein [Balneola sp.]MBE80440.1 hypothetical protein [Balneola sp.]
MRKIIVTLIILISTVYMNHDVTAQKNLSQHFIGSWQGTGNLMGSEATFDMRWEKELGGQFLKLTFQNSRTPENSSPVTFNAIAMYRPGEKGWTGTWFDVRGISFPLKGQVEGNTLSVDWGRSDTEQGRTVYALQNDGSMIVTDFIQQQGIYTQFAKATYNKK